MIYLPYQEVASEIEAAVSAGKPYSLIRLGDGENSVLRYPGRCLERRIQHVMSRALEERIYLTTEIDSIRAAMIEAANGSDIIGCYASWLPNQHCALFQDDLNYAGVKIGKACYPEIHFYLASSGYLSRIIGSADYVTLITGRDVKAQFDHKHGTNAEQVLLPSERKFRLNEEGGRLSHYPDT